MQKIKYLFLFCSVCAISLTASERPRWIAETPSGYIHDFYVGVGRSSASESEARNVALADALHRIVQSGTIMLQSSQVIKTQSIEKFKDGQSLSVDAIDNVVNDIRIIGESKTVKGLHEEEYYTEEHDGMFTVWSLVKIPKKNPKLYETPSKFSPVWRSVLLPSWGQFYKGESTKGYFIAGGTAILVSSGFIFSNLKITAESDAKNSRTQVLRDYYNDQSNTYNNISLACFIAVAAVYVYNVVDAVTTEGEKVYVLHPRDQRQEYIVALYATTYSVAEKPMLMQPSPLVSVKIEF